MDINIIVAIVAGVFALIGTFIAGITTYIVDNRNKAFERQKQTIKKLYQELLTFRRLEDLYASSLSTEDKTAESIRRKFRRNLRIQGYPSPGSDTTINAIQAQLKELN